MPCQGLTCTSSVDEDIGWQELKTCQFAVLGALTYFLLEPVGKKAKPFDVGSNSKNSNIKLALCVFDK